MSKHLVRRAFIVVDLGFGDAGKGTVTDYLARTHGAHTVVRFNGGAQAAHNVITPDGRHHTFSQLGAASFVPGLRTHLSRHMVLHPTALLVEARHISERDVFNVLSRVTVSELARVTTPFAQAACRLREMARGDRMHGSCGVGVGETVRDALSLGGEAIEAGDLMREELLGRKMRALQEYKRDELRDEIRSLRGVAEAGREIAALEDPGITEAWIAALAPFRRMKLVVDDTRLGEILREEGTVIFEGAQGVLLDEWRGFHPYTTWSTCTFDNALEELGAHAYDGEVTRWGVLRTYQTRHGAGPMPTEDPALTGFLPERHNGHGRWQGGFRVGYADMVLTRYALAASGGVDALAVTHTDRLRALPRWKVCTGYDQGRTTLSLGTHRDLEHQERLGQKLFSVVPDYEYVDLGDDPAEGYARFIEGALGARVRLTSHGPSAEEKRAR